MGMVTDIKWKCPECGKKNIAQLYGDLYCGEEYQPLTRKAVPSNWELKWNPPCEGCGKYRLTHPSVILVEFPISRVIE